MISGDVELRPEPTLLTVEQVAAMMSVSKRTVWRMLSAGELIQPIRVRGNTRWRHAELHEWIEAGCPKVTTNQE